MFQGTLHRGRQPQLSQTLKCEWEEFDHKRKQEEKTFSAKGVWKKLGDAKGKESSGNKEYSVGLRPGEERRGQ